MNASTDTVRAHLHAAVALLLVAAGCRSPDGWSEQADGEVYPLIDQRLATLGEEGPFTIDPPASTLRDRILAGEAGLARPLGLVDLVAIAAENSREYQTRKEDVYRVALDVTRERYDLSWIPSAGASASLNGSGSTDETVAVTPSAALTRVLGTGAQVLLGLTWSLTKTLPDGDVQSTVTDLFDFRQPLLRGFGRLITEEDLTQAEHNLVYEVRAYERFRRTFAFDVAERLYRVLQEVDTVENEERNRENLQRLRERNEALARAGRLSEIQVDQARQDELRAENRVILARARLGRLLDDLKLFLGLPIDFELELDQAELERLSSEGLAAVDVEPERATSVALAGRLDYVTALDRAEDAERHALVAADALRIGLDIAAGVDSVQSEAGQPLDFDLENVEWSLGAALDLPVDRLPERNVYRAALIDRELAARAAEQTGDSITLEVRDDLRRIEAAREDYQIQTNAVTLARRRIESTVLNLQAGRATTRDLLEAQEDLVAAENAATAALIEYTLARLSLFLDLELLRVDERGIWIAEIEAGAAGPPEP